MADEETNYIVRLFVSWSEMLTLIKRGFCLLNLTWLHCPKKFIGRLGGPLISFPQGPQIFKDDTTCILEKLTVWCILNMNIFGILYIKVCNCTY